MTSRRDFFARFAAFVAAIPFIGTNAPRQKSPTLYGISTATFKFWRNSQPATAVHFDQLRAEMRTIYDECQIGGNTPECIYFLDPKRGPYRYDGEVDLITGLNEIVRAK